MKSTSQLKIRFSDIPWPPIDNPLLLEAGDSPMIIKNKMKRALLIWHPDKFSCTLGSRLDDRDRKKIEVQANSVLQKLLKFKGDNNL